MKSAAVELEGTKGPEAKTMGFPDKGFREKLVDFLGFCPRARESITKFCIPSAIYYFPPNI